MKRKRKNACVGKKRFEESEAIGYAIKSRGAGMLPLVAYRCRYCSAWHVGALKGQRLEYLFRQIEKERAAR